MVDISPYDRPIRQFLAGETARLGNHLKALEISWYIQITPPMALIMTLSSIPSEFAPATVRGEQVIIGTIYAHIPGAFAIFRNTAGQFCRQYRQEYPKLCINIPDLWNIDFDLPYRADPE